MPDRDDIANILAANGLVYGTAGLAGMPALEARLKLMKALGDPVVDMDNDRIRRAVQDLEDIAHRDYDPGDFFEKYTRGGSTLANTPLQFTDAAGVRQDAKIGDYVLHQKQRMADNPTMRSLMEELDAIARTDGKFKTALDHIKDEHATLDSLAHYRGFSKSKRNAARTLLNELHEGVYPGRGMPLTAAGAGDKGTNLIDLLSDVISKPRHTWNKTIADWREAMPDGSRLGGQGETTKFDDLLDRIAKNTGIQDVLDDKSLSAAEKAQRIRPMIANAYGVDLTGDTRTVAEYFDNAVVRDAAQQAGLLPKGQDTRAMSALDDPEAVKKLPKKWQKRLRRAAWREMQASRAAAETGKVGKGAVDPRIQAVIEEQAANKRHLGAANAALERAKFAKNPALDAAKAQLATREAERAALEEVAKKNVADATAEKANILAKIQAGEIADDDAIKATIKGFDDIIDGETTWHKLKGADQAKWAELWDTADDAELPGINALNNRIRGLMDADAANIRKLTEERDAVEATRKALAGKLKDTFHTVASEGFSSQGLHKQLKKTIGDIDRRAGHSGLNLSRLFKSDDLLDFATRLSASTMTQAPKGYSAIAWNMDKIQKFRKNLPKIKKGIAGAFGLGSAALGSSALLTDENNEFVHNAFKGAGGLTGLALGARAGLELNRVGGKAGKPVLQGAAKALYGAASKHKKLRGLRSAGKLLHAISKQDTMSSLIGRGVVGAGGAGVGGLAGAGIGYGSGSGLFKLLASDPAKAEDIKDVLPALPAAPVVAPKIEKPALPDVPAKLAVDPVMPDTSTNDTTSLLQKWKTVASNKAKSLIDYLKQKTDGK